MSAPKRRLAAVIAGAALIAVAAIIISNAASEPEAPQAPKATLNQPAADLAGIPEKRGVLGDPGAPATLTEFVDPQCPVCAAAARDVLPTLVDDYVRTGKLKLDARVLSFLGPDSVTAAEYADGARAQNRLWPFLETLYANQGEENSGYMTESFLARIAKAAGVDDAQARAHDGNAAVSAASAEAKRLGVTGTPTFVLTKADGSRSVVDPSQLAETLR